MPEDSKIGQLNGKWALLFKATLAACTFFIPSMLAVGTFLVVGHFELKETVSVNDTERKADINLLRSEIKQLSNNVAGFMSDGPRYTPKDAKADNIMLKQEILKDVSAQYPPAWLTKEVESLSRRVEALSKEIALLSRKLES